MKELIAAVLGALAAYVFDIRRGVAERRQREKDEERERRRLRATVATALLHDVRGLETTLRQLYSAKRPAQWVGQKPSLYFDTLRGEVRLFAAESIPKVDEFYRRVENLFGTLTAAPQDKRGDETFNHFIKVTAGFCLQALPDAKDALVAEGGEVPPPRVLEVIQYPNLPKIPAPVFPDVPAPGSELPDELK